MTGLTIGAAALDGSDEGDDVIINPYRFASAGGGGTAAVSSFASLSGSTGGDRTLGWAYDADADHTITGLGVYALDAESVDISVWVKPSAGSYPATPNGTVTVTTVKDTLVAADLSSSVAVSAGDEVTIAFYPPSTNWNFETLADTTFTSEFLAVATPLNGRRAIGVDTTSGAVPSDVVTTVYYGVVDLTFTS